LSGDKTGSSNDEGGSETHAEDSEELKAETLGNMN